MIAASSGRLLAQDGTTKINMALGWVPTVQYAGLWIADARNYLSDAHISPEWAPGGPNAPDPLAQLAADSAQIALGEWLPFLDARAKGNDFVILGAIYQKAPNAIMSLARKPILTLRIWLVRKSSLRIRTTN
ncbi:ABC-type nitrate/sulfonate/bicarbonate transport system substrate-binding protein [Rhizobium sp. BK313]|uniref:ABC transporter substrate-binding protein n=1 Tax=Rhizobium sp. BK313 TaxID=2587081 RepID=UPI00105F5DCC|nr:ABC-type nitrate/sulfonate/bicarbonate transport system substrate-binding protein [Rhizobium sp. BK313]